jgi:ethanolamine ammonia-lyase large subunit
MDNLLIILGVADCEFILGVSGANDIIFGYQSTSFHDSHHLRQVPGLRPAHEFGLWRENMRIATGGRRRFPVMSQHA